jgi:ribosomal protein S18 acetylase RimI-like enzyme
VSDSIDIVHAEIGDLDDVAPLFDAYRAFYNRAGELEAGRRFLQERTANGESIILLARVDGAAAGFTQLYPSFSSVRLGRTMILNDLFVAPEHRRKGVARALCDRAVEIAREHNCVKVDLMTQTENTSAQALYEGMGFRKEAGFWAYNLQL